MAVRKAKEGDVNKNGQELIFLPKDRMARGEVRPNWVMRCGECDHEYEILGPAVHQCNCPECKEAYEGSFFSMREFGADIPLKDLFNPVSALELSETHNARQDAFLGSHADGDGRLKRAITRRNGTHSASFRCGGGGWRS